MSLRQRLTDLIWRSRRNLGLDNLKHTYQTLLKNKIVTENNKGMLVEALRSMAENLIWGDQNDSSVFDYFLEKNMQSFFLDILDQREGTVLSVQILQTLNILFENTHNETSIYYLMSNDHVTSIISYPFNFHNEEILAYYISFLKTLSMKLNKHTIYLFFNDVKHLMNFPLYTEAIKFFDNPESMVRIAVRTLTLNVFRVDNKEMLAFICKKTATCYFSNLVYFIGDHALQFDRFLKKDASHLTLSKLHSLTEGHLDEILYVQDILSLCIPRLGQMLRAFLLNNLTIPLYIRSLCPAITSQVTSPSDLLSVHTALFLLIQIILNMEDPPMLNTIASCLVSENANSLDNFYYCPPQEPESPQRQSSPIQSQAQFVKPNLSVSQTLSSLSLQAKYQSYVPSIERHTGTSPMQRKTMYDDQFPREESGAYPQRTIYFSTQSSRDDSTPDYAFRRIHSSKTANDTMPMFQNKEYSLDKIPPFEQLPLIDPVNHQGNDDPTRVVAETVETTGERIHPLSQEGSTDVSDPDPTLSHIPQYPALDSPEPLQPAEMDSEGIFLLGSPSDEFQSPITSPPRIVYELEDLRPAQAPATGQLHPATGELQPLSLPPADSIFPPSDTDTAFQVQTADPDKPFISHFLHLLSSVPDDRNVILSCGLLSALLYNENILPSTIAPLLPSEQEQESSHALIDIILRAIDNVFHRDNCSRLTTLELLIHLYSQVRAKQPSQLTDHQIATLESIKEGSISQLRLCYTGPQDTMFADTLDLEYKDVQTNKINLKRLLNNPSILLPPCPTPLSGVELSKRLPCGENELCRSKIRTFCLIRNLYNSSLEVEESMLPLVPTQTSVTEKETINLSNSELVYCLLPTSSGQMLKRFIGIRSDEFVLVEAKQEQTCKGVVHYIAFVKHVSLTEDTEDKLRLHLRMHKPGRATSYLSTSLVFQDSIRCMAAVQALHRATQQVKYKNAVAISNLLSLPQPPTPDTASLSVTRSVMRNISAQPLSIHPSVYQVTRPVPSPAEQTDEGFVHVGHDHFVTSNSSTALIQPSQIFASSSYPAKTYDLSPALNNDEIELARFNPKPSP